MPELYHGPYYYEFYSTVKQLLDDDGECFICGCKTDLEPHHIRRVHMSNGAYSNSDNIVLLCRLHHKLYHSLYDNNGGVNQKTFYLFCKREWGLSVKNRDNTINQLKAELKRVKSENRSLKRKLDDINIICDEL